MTTALGVAAAFWGIVMGLAPALQIRRMWVRRSSQDVSIRYFAVLLPGFALWIAYGVARADWALIVPNAVALVVVSAAIAVAAHFRTPSPDPSVLRQWWPTHAAKRR
jgi:MtN3 and saliva related transmembrane protein